MPTIVDVAKQAKVSISTVSYALSGTRPISEETKRRIFLAMDELNYHPHALARGLASRRSRLVAFHAPPLVGTMPPTDLGFATGAAEAARSQGYSLLLATFPLDNLDALREQVQQGLIDGIILMDVLLMDPRVALLRGLGFPFALIGRCANNDGVSYVDLDYDQTIGGAVRYLASLGRRQIHMLSMAPALVSLGYGPAVRGPEAFRRALAESDLSGTSEPCEPTQQAGYTATDALLHREPGTSGLVVYNNRAVPGVLQALQDHGRGVPDDFSVVAVTALPPAVMSRPGLTIAAMPSDTEGRRAAEILFHQLENPLFEPVQELVQATLLTPQMAWAGGGKDGVDR